jgi:hypothetical protein
VELRQTTTAIQYNPKYKCDDYSCHNQYGSRMATVTPTPHDSCFPQTSYSVLTCHILDTILPALMYRLIGGFNLPSCHVRSGLPNP